MVVIKVQKALKAPEGRNYGTSVPACAG